MRGQKPKEKSFEKTILRQFLRSAYLPGIVLLILFVFVYYFASNYTVRAKTRESSYQIALELSTLYQQYAEHLVSLSEHEDFASLAREGAPASGAYWQVYSFINRAQVKGSFYLVSDDGRVLVNTANAADELVGGIVAAVRPALDREAGVVLAEPVRLRTQTGESQPLLLGMRCDAYEQPLYLFYLITGDDLEQLIFAEGAEIVVVTDRFDNVIASTTSLIHNQMGKFSPDTVNGYTTVHSTRYAIYSYQINTPRLRVSVMRTNIIGFWELMPVMGLLLCIASLLLVFMHRYSRQIVKEVTAPLNQLVSAVEQLQEGNFDISVSIDSEDEFALLGNRFNEMARDIKALMERNMELVRIQKSAEINQLKAQLNPHFLFNVLETLRYSIAANSEQSQEIVLRLSNLLRTMVYRTSELTSLGEDMQQIQHFLFLHKIRFGERLVYTIDLPPELEAIQVPHLLLQPLLENSIKFSMQSQPNLRIAITCCETKTHDIALTVSDNAGGMTAERLAEIEERLTMSKEPSESIGLYTTHRMLQLLYGSAYGITLRNRPLEGLDVTITLPGRNA